MEYSHGRKFGQNFLDSPEIVSKILDIAGIGKTDVVLEVGPGRGALTFEIVKRVKKVFAIEKDRDLARRLQEDIEKDRIKNCEVIEGDIRDIHPSMDFLGVERYILLGNIPYYITARLFRKFLEEELMQPEKIIFMVQREIAERIVSCEPDHTLLSVSIRAYGVPAIELFVPRTMFSPPPRVDSSVISVSLISRKRFTAYGVSEKDFFRVLRAGFSHPRKVIISNIAEALSLEKKSIGNLFQEIGIQEKARPSELSIEQWFLLVQRLGLSI